MTKWENTMTKTAIETRYMVCAVSISGLLVSMAVLALYYSNNGLYADNYYIGRDFINYWTGATTALNGDALKLFDRMWFIHEERSIFGEKLANHEWSYPPSMLLLLLPLGVFPYYISYFLWSIFGLIFYVWAGRRGDSKTQFVVLVGGPIVMINFFLGQNGLITGALFLGALRFWDKKPVLSGILFGLLTIKPHLGMLVPVALLLTGRWIVILAAGFTTVGLILVSTLAFGLESWELFFNVTLPQQAQIVKSPADEVRGFFLLMPSAFIAARIYMADIVTAQFIQFCFSFFALAIVVWGFTRKQADPVLQQALLVSATFLFSPYCFNYDMAVLSGIVSWLVVWALHHNKPMSHHILFMVVWCLPFLLILLAANYLPLSPVILVILCVYLMREMSLSAAK